MGREETKEWPLVRPFDYIMAHHFINLVINDI